MSEKERETKERKIWGVKGSDCNNREKESEEMKRRKERKRMGFENARDKNKRKSECES